MRDYMLSIRRSAEWLKERLPWLPEVCVVLGTGLGGVAERLDVVFSADYGEIPGFLKSTSPSHAGRLVAGSIGDTRVVVCQGRFHYYEGYSARDVAFPVRVMASLGADILVSCSASGGLNRDFSPGDLMTLSDHLNLVPDNPLRGENLDELGERFPDMSTAYTPVLRRGFAEAASSLGLDVREGVFVAVPGPSLETPAETRFLRMAGGDAVAMSMVPEVIAAVHAGMKVLGVAVIANVNDPDNFEPVLIEDVVRNAEMAERNLSAILGEFLRRRSWNR
jgi:purine-nucleoside phosphorylase